MDRARVQLPPRLSTATSASRSDRSPIRSLDAANLERDLVDALEGEVRFDDGSRALYSTDASNYRQVPIGVVVPRNADDVARTVDVCRSHGAPILSRGGGTSLAGQCCNVAVVIDFSKYMHDIVLVDPDERRAVVQPGVILDRLRESAERFNLTFAPDPSTHEYCTLGGMIGNNSCGVHSVMGGKTDDNVEDLEVLTYDGLRIRVGPTSEEELAAIIAGGGRHGEIYAELRDLRDRYSDRIRRRFPKIPRRVSGYNLDQLLPENGFHVARALVGTESTCVTVLEATVRLVPSPPARVLVVLGFPDVYVAAERVPDVLESGPTGLEGMDDRLVSDMKEKTIHPGAAQLLPPGNGWLMVEFGADTREEVIDVARGFADRFDGTDTSAAVFDDPDEAGRIWDIRKSGLAATARVPGQRDTWPGWEDSAVPPERLGGYLRDLRKTLDRYGYFGDFYGHFGQGCVHTRISFDLTTVDGIGKYREFAREAADLVASYGGSFSGEHGDGQARGELLSRMYGDELVDAFREFKAIWDPMEKMNPGKVVDPYPLDANLRFGTGYNAPSVETHFQYPDDEGSLARAVTRCVGVGKCRRESGGIMCPSYMVTREEEHSTRGRARVLFEMLQGDPLDRGWREDHVLDALDLCLSCKGCKTECPMGVDMATYKAEFYSHYYSGRLRPRAAYSMGLIYWWSRLASHVPQIANFAAHARGLSYLLKRVGGVATERDVPLFAPETFRSWYRRRGPKAADDAPPVLLWPDTFNNYFHPQVAKATVEVLEAAGFRVVLPEKVLCCGRPLYDFGMLPTAKRLLRQILDELRPEIAEGVPVVGMEPSCVAVFRDELPEVFPHDEDAKRLAGNAFVLSEFLQKRAQGFEIPELNAGALVQHHCHHKSVLGFGDEERVLERLGLDAEVLDSGCCGMAGSFGFEAGEKYRVSVAAGERVLLPAVRKASDDTLLIADGFSCREQIRQGTGRRALHLAEVIAMALHRNGGEESRHEPERRGDATKRLAYISAALLLAVAAYRTRRRVR